MALYLANDRSPRTRANAGELARIRANSARVRQPFANFFISRTPPTFARVRRTFGELSANSPEFARIRAESAANWRTVRQKMSPTPTSFTYTANDRSPRTIVRQPRTIVHHKLKFYPYFLANDRSPRTKVRHGEPVRREQSFAANDFTIRVRVVSNQRQKSFAVKR